MAFSFRKLGIRFFVMVNLGLCLIFLICCLQPWLNPETFWIFGFLSLAFPYLLLLVLGFAFFWLIIKIRYVLISLIALLLAWKQIEVLFNLQSEEFVPQKTAGNIRVLSWNIRSFQGLEAQNGLKKQNANNIFHFIESLSPDVVCFQEFGQYDSPEVKRNYLVEMEKIGFKFHVLSKDYNRGGPWGYSNGVAIFSKSAFIGVKRIPFSSSPESVLYADLVLEGDTVRLFTTHLQSFKFSGNDYRDIGRIKNTDDSLYEASYNILSKMRTAFRNRGSQADMLRTLLDTSRYPEIMTCDMNDVPSSYAYWQLRGKRKDTFLEKGFGIGRTYLALAPTLRIDYIMADEKFSVEQFEISNKLYSDHLPVIADLRLIKDKVLPNNK